MPWFRVDDGLQSHPKARHAGLTAMGLWTVSGAYAAQYLTDGFVPTWYVNTWPNGKRSAAKLVDAGLWYADRRNGETGWSFHQWDERQPTKAEVEADRAASRERQKQWRDRRRSNSVTNSVTNGISNGTPTLPIPTQPSYKYGATADAATPAPTNGELIVATESAGTLIGEWIDHCTIPPPAKVKGQIAREVKTLLDEGVPYDLVRAGLAAWHDKGLHPSTLASVVHEVANAKPRRNGKQQDRDQLFAAALQRAAAADAAGGAS